MQCLLTLQHHQHWNESVSYKRLPYSSAQALSFTLYFSLWLQRWGLSVYGLLVSVICISLIHHDCLRWMKIHQELIFIPVSVVVSNRHSSPLKQLDVIWFPQVCSVESVNCWKCRSGFISLYFPFHISWFLIEHEQALDVVCIYVEACCNVKS